VRRPAAPRGGRQAATFRIRGNRHAREWRCVGKPTVGIVLEGVLFVALLATVGALFSSGCCAGPRSGSGSGRMPTAAGVKRLVRRAAVALGAARPADPAAEVTGRVTRLREDRLPGYGSLQFTINELRAPPSGW
jgi:hypothetical protein